MTREPLPWTSLNTGSLETQFSANGFFEIHSDKGFWHWLLRSPGHPCAWFLGCHIADFCAGKSSRFILTYYRRKKELQAWGPGQGLPKVPALIDLRGFNINCHDVKYLEFKGGFIRSSQKQVDLWCCHKLNAHTLQVIDNIREKLWTNLHLSQMIFWTLWWHQEAFQLFPQNLRLLEEMQNFPINNSECSYQGILILIVFYSLLTLL